MIGNNEGATITKAQEPTDAMIEAGIAAHRKELFGYYCPDINVQRATVIAIYLAMEAAKAPTKDRETASPASEKLTALRRMCEASGQPFYVEIIDEVLAALNSTQQPGSADFDAAATELLDAWSDRLNSTQQSEADND